MKLFEIKNLKEDDLGTVPPGDDPGLDDKKKQAPKKKNADDEPEEDDTPPVEDDAPTDDDVAPEAPPAGEGGNIDFDAACETMGFEKTKKQMYAFGGNREVTVLTKNTLIGDNSITLQYIINPKPAEGAAPGAWSLRAGLEGHKELEMIEVGSGNDPQSLYKNMKKKHKITPLQVQQLLNPPEEHSDVNDDTQPTQQSGEEEQ